MQEGRPLMPGTPSEAQSRHTLMTETPIPRLVTRMAMPTMASMLVTSIYNMADTYFVGMLGQSASGAVGVVFTLMLFIQAIGFTLGMAPAPTSRSCWAQRTRKPPRASRPPVFSPPCCWASCWP